MNKKNVTTKLLVGVMSSVFLLNGPLPSYAESLSSTTSVSLTFSTKEEVREPSMDVQLVHLSTEKRAHRRASVEPVSQKRLPLTGEEYDTVLSSFGWIAILLALLFFFIGLYERRGGNTHE